MVKGISNIYVLFYEQNENKLQNWLYKCCLQKYKRNRGSKVLVRYFSKKNVFKSSTTWGQNCGYSIERLKSLLVMVKGIIINVINVYLLIGSKRDG